jgi:hypothetical protein
MHDGNGWEIRKLRDHARDGVKDREELRKLASQIKQRPAGLGVVGLPEQ